MINNLSNSGNFTGVPYEIFYTIFNFLDKKSQRSLYCINQELRSMIEQKILQPNFEKKTYVDFYDDYYFTQIYCYRITKIFTARLKIDPKLPSYQRKKIILSKLEEIKETKTAQSLLSDVFFKEDSELWEKWRILSIDRVFAIELLLRMDFEFPFSQIEQILQVAIKRNYPKKVFSLLVKKMNSFQCYQCILIAQEKKCREDLLVNVFLSHYASFKEFSPSENHELIFLNFVKHEFSSWPMGQWIQIMPSITYPLLDSARELFLERLRHLSPDEKLDQSIFKPIFRHLDFEKDSQKASQLVEWCFVHMLRKDHYFHSDPLPTLLNRLLKQNMTISVDLSFVISLRKKKRFNKQYYCYTEKLIKNCVLLTDRMNLESLTFLIKKQEWVPYLFWETQGPKQLVFSDSLVVKAMEKLEKPLSQKASSRLWQSILSHRPHLLLVKTLIDLEVCVDFKTLCFALKNRSKNSSLYEKDELFCDETTILQMIELFSPDEGVHFSQIMDLAYWNFWSEEVIRCLMNKSIDLGEEQFEDLHRFIELSQMRNHSPELVQLLKSKQSCCPCLLM